MEYINCALYLALFYYTIKSHKLLLAKYFTGIWLIVSFIGTFYYRSPLYKEGIGDLTLYGFLYLFVCIMISLMPFIRQKRDIEDIQGDDKRLDAVYKAVAFLAYWPFVEIVYYLATIIANGQFFALAAAYDDIANGVGSSLRIKLSFIGNYLMIITLYLQTLSPMLLLCYLRRENKKKWVLVGLVLSSIIPAIYGIAGGSRTQLVFFSLYFSALYLLLQKTLPDAINYKLKRILFAAAGIMVLFLGLLTVGRFALGSNYGEYMISEYLYQYAGESMYNFNNGAFNVTNYQYGDVCFTPMKIRLGMSPIDDISQRRELLGGSLQVVSIWFYTFVGDLYCDFGPILTFIIIAIMSGIFMNVVKGGVIRIENLIWFSLYLYIMANGIFYFPFVAGDYPFITCLLLFIYLKMVSVKHNG